MQNISEENRAYWLKRADGYSDVNKEELAGIQRQTWSKFLTEMIDEHFKEKDRSAIKILDVGAGPGFISIILAEAGYQVTTFDFAETMLAKAKENAKETAEKINFVQGDAMSLPCGAARSAVVLSRNPTWHLPEPKQAYPR